MPAIFKAVQAGVCPKFFVTPFVCQLMNAKSWWDKGQLGFSYIESPSWVHEAFIILENEQLEAQNYKLEENRK